MSRRRITSFILCGCLLLALSGCGNKGPLVLPEETEKKTKNENQ